MPLHPLDQATSLVQSSAGRFLGETSDLYWNFAGPFGGYIAALFMKAVLQDDRRLGPPIAQTVNFCAPLARGSFEIVSSLERGGKATQHWSLRLLQQGAVMATATVVCANRRETFALTVAKPPQAPAAADVPAMQRPSALPWLRCYDFRFVEGGPNIGGAPLATGELGSSRTVLWLRDNPPRPLDFQSLAALSDCFILRLLQVRGGMVPMGTVSMTTYVHATEAELAAQESAPLLGVADAKRFAANFHDQSMELWGKEGRLLASGVQTVWFKE